ncbi:UPF0746 protein DDB_G0281095 [Cyclospora cayetanensis]|uniref:UPF0746 protein DDB_G0281095 n=1 Tax=Cyclospora cayetanensis TaxID=88456 RepID=A0A6P6S2Z5_9EIME|nr:UPF0746 protein DDB_G0281095 [Cyclospora cayetanensis]
MQPEQAHQQQQQQHHHEKQQQQQQHHHEKQQQLQQHPPDPSKRRRSTTVSQDHAGCYLAYDQNLSKWIATWSPVYMLEAAAILSPRVKVPQFKYNKKERVVLEGEKSASRDVKKDYYSGICSFFKLVRDFKGDLTLLPAAEDFELKEMILVGLHGNEEPCECAFIRI